MTKPTNPFDASAQPMPKQKMVRQERVSADQLKEVLAYDSTTGVFTWRFSMNSRVPAGSVAGSLKSDSGYVLVNIKGVFYRAHRLAWLYMYGEWPSAQLDHINGVRHDNRISNLRNVSNAENQQNLRAPHSDNVTGLLGVSRNLKGFRARIKFDGKQFHLGTFKTPELAHAAYLCAKRRHHSHGDFAKDVK